MNSPYYVPSGHLPAQALVLAICCTLLVVVPALLYAWFTRHAHFFLLDWLALLVFAAGMGRAAEFVAHHGKARSPRWMGRLGLAIGIVGWYAQWAGWLALADAGRFTDLLADPHGMWRFAMTLTDSEAARVSGMRIGGSVLATGWILEFILLTMIPRSRGRAAAESPFCERTDSWTTPFALPRKFAFVHEPLIVVHRLENAPDQLLSILQTCTEEDPSRYSAVTLHFSGGDAFISIDNIRVEEGTKRGATWEKWIEIPVIAYLRLPGTVASQLLGDSTNIVFPTPTSPASA